MRKTLFDISPETILKAAQEAYGRNVQVSAPYWVGEEVVRVGVSLDYGNMSFGANYHYKEGKFH